MYPNNKQAPARWQVLPVLQAYGLTDEVSQDWGWVPVHCPFHDDRNRSAAVNLELEKFYCFACGISEDAIGVVQHADGLGYRGALAKVEELSESSDRSVRREPGLRAALFGGARDQRGSRPTLADRLRGGASRRA